MSVFTDIGLCYTLSGLNNNTITKTSGKQGSFGGDWDSAAFGRQIITCDTAEIIKYEIKFDKARYVCAGIVSNLHNQNGNQMFDGQHSYKINFSDGAVDIEGQRRSYKTHNCATGDSATLIINTSENKLYLMKNKNENDIRFITDIKTEADLVYRFALSIYRIGDSVTVNDNNNGNNGKEKQEKAIITSLKTENDKVKNDNNKIEESQNDEKTIELLRKEIHEMRKEMNEMKKEILNALKQNNGNSNHNDAETKDVYEFLTNTVNLPQYINAFVYAGFTDLKSFGHICAEDLKEMGVKLAHRHTILMAISNRWHK
eukprot:394374_1